MKEIQLTQGKVALVDDEDFEYLSQFSWHYFKPRHPGSTGYATRKTPRSQGHKAVMMHDDIMKDKPIDHKNGDGLDNRRDNLRKCTTSQNGINRNKQRNNTTGYKGVWKLKTCNRWEANIKKDRKKIYLGIYDNPEDAARAYDAAAIRLHGEFARLNFPQDGHDE